MTTHVSAAPADTSRRRTALLLATAALTALALVAFMITSVTRATWTDTTANPDNSWGTGTVTLTDDAVGAMFSATDMVPGDEVDNSITVTNESTVPLDVKLYGEGLTDTNDLAQHLNLEIGTTSGGDDVYSGTLDGFITTHSDYASGTAVIDLGVEVGVDDSQTYYFWVQLDDAAPDGTQGSSAQIDFVWEGQTQ